MGPGQTRHAPNGMVASVDHLASGAGLAMLRLGGTAADTAVASSAVLAVTAPHLCGMGGDLFALVHSGTGPPRCLNASGRAGSMADPDRLRAEGHTEMPFRGDPRSAPVPGCVDGWLALHDSHGRLPLREVLTPAIRYATDGFPCSPLLALAIPLLAGVAGTEDLADPPPRAGERIRRPGVARVLDAIATSGRAGFYGGEFGAALLEVPGIEVTAADLAEPLATWVEPLGAEVHGHTVWTVPPNSQGYLTLLGLLIAEGLDLPDDPCDPAWAHLLIESARAAGADRPAVLYEDADVLPLLATAEVELRRAAVRPDRRATLPGSTRVGDTMFLAAADADGTGVSLIQSNAAGFGCHIAVGATGILLHNRGVGFSLQPGHPAEYRAGRRPPHTLAPTLVTDRAGRLSALVGTMGGDSQPQILLQILTRLLRHGASAGEAVGAGRWVLRSPTAGGFDTWADPASHGVAVEDACRGWVAGLTEREHTVVVEPAGSRFGHAQVIVAGSTGGWEGASDPRAEIGAAAGY